MDLLLKSMVVLDRVQQAYGEFRCCLLSVRWFMLLSRSFGSLEAQNGKRKRAE
jgi:hypothetical protein